MKTPLLALLILFSTYTFGQNSFGSPQIGIKVPLGKTLEYKGISIKFMEVLEDSCCPKDVTCIWAGRAIVKAEVSSEGNTEEKTLIFGEVRPGEEKSTTLYSSKEFSIDGLTLNPYPTSQGSEDTNYVLVVSEKMK